MIRYEIYPPTVPHPELINVALEYPKQPIDVYLDLGKMDDDAKIIHGDLLTILSAYLYQLNTWQTREKMRADILDYFRMVWPEITLHRTVVDSLSNGSEVFVGVYGAINDNEEDINYEVDYFIDTSTDDALWEAIMSQELQGELDKPIEVIESVDDILYSSIDKSKIHD